MIYKAKEISRNQQSKLNNPVRGYYTKGPFEYLDLYLEKYNSGIVTLKTALSIHGIIDEWVEFPFDLCFRDGYRKISNPKVNQFREKIDILFVGAEMIKRNNSKFKIYNKERLLIELWRKEKYISKDIYKEAIFKYRLMANDGSLNIPLIKKYINLMPKSQIYLKRLSAEIL